VVTTTLDAFCISLSLGIEAIAGLILIHLYLQKLSKRFQLRTQTLLSNHIIKSMLESRHLNINNNHCLLLEELTSKQQLNIKSSIVDMNNRLNRVFPSFNSLSIEFSPRNRLIDIFPSHFSFYYLDHKNKESRKVYIHKLDEFIFQALPDLKTAVVVLDMSIKNQVATSIAYIHVHNNYVIKTLYYAINVTSTEAELFAIRCSINQATQMININCIIIITDLIYATKKIFDSLVHLYQIQSSTISRKLREFFRKDQHNFIEFWNCPSCDNWTLHHIVNKETKKFNLVPIFPCKSLWEFDRKNECNKILNNWKMMFQALNVEGRQFLELFDNNLQPIEPSYSKGGSWLKYFSHSNSLCTRASRAIINHAPIGEYHLRFFPQEEFKYSCGQYPIETR